MSRCGNACTNRLRYWWKMVVNSSSRLRLRFSRNGPVPFTCPTVQGLSCHSGSVLGRHLDVVRSPCSSQECQRGEGFIREDKRAHAREFFLYLHIDALRICVILVCAKRTKRIVSFSFISPGFSLLSSLSSPSSSCFSRWESIKA